LRKLAQHRFHLVEAAPYTGVLSDRTKIHPDMELLNHLHAAGRTEAEKWLAANRRAIGRRSTVNLRTHFEAVRAGRTTKPKDPVEAITAPAHVKGKAQAQETLPAAPLPATKSPEPPRAARGGA
jgi:hypothetical protein